MATLVALIVHDESDTDDAYHLIFEEELQPQGSQVQMFLKAQNLLAFLRSQTLVA